jgi:chromosome segregation ATPase
MSTSDFLANFEASLNKLNKLNDYITRNTTNKKEFTGFVLTKLRELNEKIKLFITRFNELKAQVVTLQSQINDNSSGIQNKDGEIANLKSDLERLTKEKNDLKEFVDNEIPKNTQKSVDLEKETKQLQNNIDAMETKMRELESENAELTNQKNTLQQELSSRGDVQSEHAKAIEELSNKNKAELAKAQQDNAAQIDELQKQNDELQKQNDEQIANLNYKAQKMEEIEKQITEKENQIQGINQKIQELEQKIAEKDSQLAEKDRQIAELQQNTSSSQQQQQQNAEAITQASNRIKQLEKEKADLENINKDLVERIIAATNAINIATAQLEELVNQGFYDKSKQDVDVLIKEIEESLQLISNSIQGNSNAPPNSNQNVSSGRYNNPKYNRNLNINGKNTNLKDLIIDLKGKSDEQDRNSGGRNIFNKYKGALQFIEDILSQTPNISESDLNLMVKSAINKYNIEFYQNFNKIRGGFKNKKNTNKIVKFHKTRKQKGGYLWGKQKTTSLKSSKTSKIFLPSKHTKKRL